MPAAAAKRSICRCGVLLTPGEPKLTLPALALARAMNSAKFETGVFAFTTRMNGNWMSVVTGTKAVGSKPSFG